MANFHSPKLGYAQSWGLPKVGETPYTHEQNGQTGMLKIEQTPYPFLVGVQAEFKVMGVGRFFLAVFDPTPTLKGICL